MKSTSSKDRVSKTGPRNVIKLNSTILTLLLFKEPVNVSLQPDGELKGKSDNIFLYISSNICLNQIKDSKRIVEPTIKKTELVCHGDWKQRNKSVNYKSVSTFLAVPGSSQSLQLIPSALTPWDVSNYFFQIGNM